MNFKTYNPVLLLQIVQYFKGINIIGTGISRKEKLRNEKLRNEKLRKENFQMCLFLSFHNYKIIF